MSSLIPIFRTPETNKALREVDARTLDRQVNGRSNAIDRTTALNRLRVAAVTSFTELLGDRTVDAWLRTASAGPITPEPLAEECFASWQGFLNALGEVDSTPSIDDLFFFSIAGFLACKPHEVRDALRRPVFRTWLDGYLDALPRSLWIDRVRAYVSLAILLVVRQSNREDIEKGGAVLRQLAGFQRDTEARWLDQQENQKRDALTLLGFYHLAQSVIRVSEFLLSGTVSTNGRALPDVMAELRRLLVRAEEFLSLAGDSENTQWLVAASMGLVFLRGESIWIQSRGISQRIDQLLEELTQEGRPYPVFSLLPSQQEALRHAFLDRSKLAIVLQMPTSAGKTLLAEFAIVQTFDAYRDEARVVYIVPTRALATQIRRTLAEDLGPLGIRVSAAGSAFEEDPYELKLLSGTDGIIVTTPEKLDLMLRVHPDWFNSLRLVVVDEAHLLHDGERGVRLELLLANLRKEQPESRMLLLTPFMDNADQIARWLSRERGHSINVQWRPSRVLLGLANIIGKHNNWSFRVDWKDPYDSGDPPKSLTIPIGNTKSNVSSNTDRILFLGRKLKPLGTVLALYSASPADAEKAAWSFAKEFRPIATSSQSAQMRLAIALAQHEFGEDSRLADCLKRGVAYHHSSLSPILRYLIEDQIRSKTIGFVAATSTLAQGMNFPVATVLVHSVHKPHDGGTFSPSEFWNIAGRAGRVGMVERGLVVFADSNHKSHLNRYANELKNVLTSALLAILPELRPDRDLKEQYRNFKELRPFIQYLAHAAVSSTPARAIANLEEIIQQSLVNQQVQSPEDSRKLRTIARNYLQQLTGRQPGMLKVADETGLASFSFDELYAKLRNDRVLMSGPREVLEQGEAGLYKLVDILRWLPELDLALGFGAGDMNVQAVAEVINDWIKGHQVHEIAEIFPGSDTTTKRRKAAQYLYSTVSQTISWGAHAYLRGWLMSRPASEQIAPEDRMLPAYVQYGVHTPEAAVASLLGVPRPFAESMGQQYRERSGPLIPENAVAFQAYVESADDSIWQQVVERAGVTGVRSADIRKVFLQMHGMTV
jgi:hypothetical protein